MQTDLVSIAGPSLSASISPHGAELQSLKDGAGRDLLWDGDPAFWTGRAPILFPVVGNLRDGRYRLGDRYFPLPRHGFARAQTFTPVVQETGRAVLRLDANAQTRTVYPFEFRLDVVFALEGAQLSMAGEVTNMGDEPMPAGFGFHPAFRWPLPYGAPRSEHEIVFADDEPEPIRRLGSDGLVDAAPVPTPVRGRVLTLKDGLFENDAIIMTAPRSRSLTYGAPQGPKLGISYADFPQLGIWSKPGAGYVCIEPWQSYADLSGFSGELWDKPGIVRIAPGETRRWTMTVALLG